MDKEKPFAVKDQEIINEYNKKRSKEITEEHLNNIEKLREDFKKEVINEYKEKLIKFLKNLFMETDNWEKQIIISINLIIHKELMKKIENGDFDNE